LINLFALSTITSANEYTLIREVTDISEISELVKDTVAEA